MKKNYLKKTASFLFVFYLFFGNTVFAKNTISFSHEKTYAIKKHKVLISKNKMDATSRKKIVAAPIISLDATNVTGAGGVNINTKACSQGYEILDNTNTGATSNFNSLSTVMSMTITLVNPQDGVSEQLSIGGTYPGVLVAGNGTQTLTITNSGSASTNTMRTVLDDLIYKDLVANPNTVVQRQVTVQVTDALGQVSNTPIAYFNVIRTANSGNTPGPIIVFTTGTTVSLPTGLDGSQDAGGTWTDVDATGALVGSTVTIATLPLGGSSFSYNVASGSPCGTSTTTVLVIKMNATELPMTSNTACGVLETNYTNPLYSANSNDPIYIFNQAGNTGKLECPAGVAVGTTYNWYKYNPTTNSYDNYALNSTRTQLNLPDGGYLVVRNDAGVTTEGRAWVWNIPAGVPNAGIDAVVCAGDTYTLNGSVGGLIHTFTHYNPVQRPLIITASTKISVRFSATHTYVSDLGYFFVNPTGTKTITLGPNQTNICNSGDNVNNLTFTNQGPNSYFNFCMLPVPSTSTGTYNGYFQRLPLPGVNTLIDWSPLIGENANIGGWKVQVYDCVPQDIGSLTNVTITFDDGAGNITTYASGTISSPINDNSCDPASASIYTVPSTPAVAVTRTLTINPNIGINGPIGGWQWSYSTDGLAGPYTNFNKLILNPVVAANQNTWVKLSLNNGVSTCIKEDIMFIQANPKPNAGVPTNLTQFISPPIISLANQLAGETSGGTWTLISGTPGVGAFNAVLGTLNPVLAGVGTYGFQYAVTGLAPCPSDSKTFTVTLTLPTPLVANTDTTPAINGLVGGTTAKLTVNDTLNGVLNPTIGTAPGNVSIATVGVVPTGLTLNADGTVSVAANTPASPAGGYSLSYTICEINNPSNCSTVESFIVVSAPALVANADTTPAINGLVGGTTAKLTVNDTLNGVLNPTIGTAPGNVSIATVGVVPTGLTLNADGTVSVAANTPASPAGGYSLSYTICEINNPSNCNTVESFIVVSAPALVANADTTPAINGLVGGTTAKLTVNDSLNGVLNPTIGTAPGNVSIATVGVVPTGLTLNADGTVSVAANTPASPAGGYSLSYQICEINNPSNCNTVESFIVVSAPALVANTDTTPAINGLVGGTTAKLTVNDTLNGVLNPTIGTAPGNVSIATVGVVPTGLTLNADGTVSVAANTPASPAGGYSLSYTICEINNPSNCNTVESFIVVSAPALVANADTTPTINGLVGGTTAKLTVNDTLNGVLNPTIGTAPGNVSIATVGVVPTGLTLNADGTVSVAANTPASPAGGYSLSYTICEINNPSNCSTVESFIVVSAPALVANADTTPAINGLVGGTTAKLTVNDTLNGVLNPTIGTAPGNVSIATVGVVPTGLTLNADGTVSVAANTPASPAGGYSLSYTICEINNPSNCSTVESFIVVSAPALVANTDTTPAINGLVGGTTAKLTVNDTLNGVLNPTIGTAPGNVSIATVGVVPTGLTLNADGTVSVAPNTPASPAGGYSLSYQICEINNPSNCNTVESFIVVSAPALVANTETTPAINGLVGGTTAKLTVNDTLNGVLNPTIGTAPGNVSIATVGVVPTGLTLNADGTVSVAANTPASSAGGYSLSYTICEINNPSNCSTVESFIVVSAPALVANTDTTPAINGLVGGTTAKLTVNDTLNGVLNPTIGTAPGNVSIATVGVVPTGLTLNADGTVSVAANTPASSAGGYSLSYTICEINNPSNCSTVESFIVVSAPALVANTDTTPAINGLVGGTTAKLTVNDTLNGVLNPTIGTAPGNVSIATVGVVPTGLTLNADGTVSVAANTPASPAGGYSLSYTICEINNPSNCSTVESFIVVSAPALVANTDTTPAINGLVGGIAGNVTSNDTLNGLPVTPANTNVTPITSGTISIDADGKVTVGASTAAGSYPITYQICEVLNPSNCKTATATIVVSAAKIIANDNSVTVTNGQMGGIVLPNVLIDDTLGGILPNNSNVNLGVVGVMPLQLTFNPATGSVSVNPLTPSGVYSFTYQICEILNPTNCDIALVTVEVKPVDIDFKLDIYNHVTPNNDGHNDFFFIDGISKFPNNTVEIYNRWGVLVYEVNGYNNIDKSFVGISEGRVTVSKNSDLPEGTYYYIIKYTDDLGVTRDKSGYLYINR